MEAMAAGLWGLLGRCEGGGGGGETPGLTLPYTPPSPGTLWRGLEPPMTPSLTLTLS